MEKNKKLLFGASLIILEISLFIMLFSIIPMAVIAGVGTPNATMITNLTVGNVYPDILNVSINNDDATITLTANSTTTVYCAVVVRDYNGEDDISAINATFYNSTLGDSDDNNTHYTNASCNFTKDFTSYNGYNDDTYSVLANCSFEVQYYANPGTWVCRAYANDSYGWVDTEIDADNVTISQLLALGVPDFIDYGTVNATEMSRENTSNVTNYGNVNVNLSLEGYGFTEGDGNAMNCTLGTNQNISIEHEKYNLTDSNTTHPMTLENALTQYTNLTTTAVVKNFDLSSRQNDTYNEAFNSTYWRIYVPLGVAGTCSGYIKFGATTADGS